MDDKFDNLLKELSKIEKDLPPTLRNHLTSLKHGLGALSFGVVKEFMDCMDDDCEYCHHTVDEYGIYDVFFDDGEGKKQSWRVGTRQMFCDFLEHELEHNEDTLGSMSTSFVVDFLTVGDDVEAVLNCDEIMRNLSVRAKIIRVLMVPDGFKSMADTLISNDGIEDSLRGYGGSQGDFEFDGENYDYFRID